MCNIDCFLSVIYSLKIDFKFQSFADCVGSYSPVFSLPLRVKAADVFSTNIKSQRFKDNRCALNSIYKDHRPSSKTDKSITSSGHIFGASRSVVFVQPEVKNLHNSISFSVEWIFVKQRYTKHFLLHSLSLFYSADPSDMSKVRQKREHDPGDEYIEDDW